MRIHDLVSHVVVLGIPGSASFALLHWWTHGRRIAICSAAGAFAAALSYTVSIFCFGHPQALVTITDHGQSAYSNWVMIDGTVSPPDARVYVLVHADANQDSAWWVQKEAEGKSGSWITQVSLGEPEKGRRTHFQLIAVASSNPAILDDVCNLGLTEGEQLPRPPALPSTDIYTIWREK